MLKVRRRYFQNLKFESRKINEFFDGKIAVLFLNPVTENLTEIEFSGVIKLVSIQFRTFLPLLRHYGLNQGPFK